MCTMWQPHLCSVMAFAHGRLMLGFMIVTAIMSMWISNTATAAMMVPIVHSVLEQLRVNLVRAQRMTPNAPGESHVHR